MSAATTCEKCGAKIPPGGTALYCLHCGERLGRNDPETVDEAMTLIESAARIKQSPGSSGTRTLAALPRAIDGFDILKLLGRGGMGSVYLAYEPLLDREVAIKVLSRAGEDQERSRAASRFLSEAVLTGRLGHSGIIPIYKVGHDTTAGFYYAMRYIKGTTLADVLHGLANRDPQMKEQYPLARLLSMFLRVCQAIGFAHQNNIVHRDIKPANLMIAEFGEVFVLDWGLAKDAAHGAPPENAPTDDASLRLAECRRRRGTTSQMFLQRDSGAAKPESNSGTSNTSLLRKLQAMKLENIRQPATQAGQILGTPGYLSPEQGQALGEVSPASDVYSLGVTLYEILTLRRPVEADSTEGLILKTMTGEIVPLSKRPEAAKIPVALREITARALALDPNERFKDAGALASEIAHYLEGRSPWKPLVCTRFTAVEADRDWSLADGNWQQIDNATALEPASRLRCKRIATGDFQLECELFARKSPRWAVTFRNKEPLADGVEETRYEFRIGNDGRSFIELVRNGAVVQRRLDLRLQADQLYHLKLQMEGSQVGLWIDGRRYIDYHEMFPHAGGAFEIIASAGHIHLASSSIVCRGAPLHLSFMALPDDLYRRGKFAEARELYRRLAASHADREEGIQAQYKAGLCSTALQDFQTAFGEFSALEGSMCDHYCALGFAQIGLIDGNVDWAWEALKNTYRTNADPEIRSEMWFALLALIQRLPATEADDKQRRYLELLSELEPEPHEAAQVTFELLDVVRQNKGDSAARTEALALLEKFPRNLPIRNEALMCVWRCGIDDRAIVAIKPPLDLILKGKLPEGAARFYIMRAEVAVALGAFDEAYQLLRDAIIEAGAATSEGIWARSWQILILYAKDQHQLALTDCHEVLARLRKHCTTSQLSYLRLIEALCYLRKYQVPKAEAALAEAARSECIWGQAAAHVLEGNPPALLEDRCRPFGSSQTFEALWFSGELFRRMNKLDLAAGHLQLCSRSPEARAFTASLADRSLRRGADVKPEVV